MTAPLRLFTSICIVLCLLAQSVLIQGQTFSTVKYLMPSGDKKKEKEVEAHLILDEDSVRAVRLKPGHVQPNIPYFLKKILYSEIKSATYSFSKHRRWRAGVAVAVVANMFAAPLFFMKGEKALAHPRYRKRTHGVAPGQEGLRDDSCFIREPGWIECRADHRRLRVSPN